MKVHQPQDGTRIGEVQGFVVLLDLSGAIGLCGIRCQNSSLWTQHRASSLTCLRGNRDGNGQKSETALESLET